ncbi:ParB/RepB/Spo0J family partition protein [Nostoc paludosum FACHB-159]|uniref:ParB/RepB/Spo0J family partition protein n=2 Tax=Nostoc TaxID=1177 RepID=A0ABR8KHB0_9NOSO|nr:ParB/RepB/Spo0J family partition protein [Nostoc sp. FACHB-857]MBD2738934.1 ParB/RepB/Spo0J family partition protein [Nostoc paludosum FACHB-159]
MFGGSEDEPATPSNKSTNTILIQEIKLPPTQPRRYFDPKKLEELSLSIKELGILEPLIVRPRPDGSYELIAGERRFKAAIMAGLEFVPVVIKEMDDDTVKQVQLIENLQREDLNAYEETIGILELLALRLNSTQDEVISLLNRMSKANRQQADNVIRQQEKKEGENADNVIRQNRNKKADNLIAREDIAIIEGVFSSVGRLSAESFRTNRLPLLNLPEDIKEALQKGSIEYTKARAIAKVKEDVKRAPLLQAAIKENLSLTEIQQRIGDILAQEKADTTPSLKTQYKELSKQLGSSKVWDNPKKKKALEKLLNQIKVLLDAEQAITKT